MNQSPLLLTKHASNRKENLADGMTLFQITNELAKTVLQTTEKLVNDPTSPICDVKQVNQVMNELQLCRIQNLLHIFDVIRKQ